MCCASTWPGRPASGAHETPDHSHGMESRADAISAAGLHAETFSFTGSLGSGVDPAATKLSLGLHFYEGETQTGATCAVWEQDAPLMSIPEIASWVDLQLDERLSR
jgi:hypothetical protein